MSYIGKQPTKAPLTASDIEDGIITAAKIEDGAVVAAEIASNAVTTAKINADAVTSAKIADNAVVTAAINADAVTGAKIADDAIDSEHYTDASIDTAHITDANVTSAKIAADAITAAKIADDAISDEHLDPTAITGQTAETSVADDDLILLSDTSASAALKKMTVANLVANAGGGKILGVATDWASVGESTTSSSYVDIPSNKGRLSYTTVGANSNFIISVMANWKQTGNHPNYLYFGNLRYLIELQSDNSVLATGNSRPYMININEGTLITDNGSSTNNDYLDPGTLAAGTDIYFQPQFNTQSTLTVAGIQTVIWEIAA